MLYPVYFQPESFQQANSVLSGMQMGNGLAQQMIQNQYLGPQLKQQLLAAQLQNQARGIQNQYMSRDLQSQISLRQAQANAQNALPGLYGAEGQEALASAGLTGAKTNLLNQQLPYLLQNTKESLITDPILRRGVELGLVQKNGMVPDSYLNMVGLGQGNNSNAPQGTTAPVGTNNLQNQAQQLGMNGMRAGPNIPGIAGNTSAQNWGIFGSPLSPLTMMQLQAAGKGMETQATTGVTSYNDVQKDAAQGADLGNQVSNLVDQFQNSYQKTELKGPALGRLPAVTGDAQAADNASQNIAATVAKLIAGGRVTNYEMQYINNLKPNRTMTPQTAQMTSDFLKQKSLRMEEQPNFFNAARQMGVSVQTAQTLWNMYNNQRPVYNFQTQAANTDFQKSSKDFLTPQAIQAAQTGQNYVPLPSFSNRAQFQNWFKTLPPSDQNTIQYQLAQQGTK